MHLLLSPLTWALLLLVGLRVLRGRTLRAAAWLGLLLCAALAAPVGANALVWVIERHLPAGPPCASDERAPLLILTGGFDYTPRDAGDYAALNDASLRRLAAGLELAARQPGVPVIVSGASDAGPAEADVAGTLALRLGLAPARLTIEPRARNTWENAERTAALLPAGARRVQLVTSALHAPRATLALRAHGVESCRRDADSIYVPMTGPGYFAPQSTSLAKAERALHELVGLASYRLKIALG